MAATLMQKGKIQRVLVGADRIAMNGDLANKIGTYSLAIQAHYHQVPFHSAAPRSTLDFSCKQGSDIPIEQRPISEIEGLSTHIDSIKQRDFIYPNSKKVFSSEENNLPKKSCSRESRN